jgi:hypothetical protein
MQKHTFRNQVLDILQQIYTDKKTFFFFFPGIKTLVVSITTKNMGHGGTCLESELLRRTVSSRSAWARKTPPQEYI